MPKPFLISRSCPPRAASLLPRRPLPPQRHRLRQANQTVLYTVHRASSKPHLTIFRAPTPHAGGFIIGKVSPHTFSSAIDLDIPGPPLVMQKPSKLTSNYEVYGNNINWRWERDGALTSNIRLVDRMGGGVLARFENATFSVTKQGTLTLSGTPMWDMLDAIIITGLAKIEHQKESSAQSSVAAASPGH
ncbi:hypothetical protein TSTA_043360 [Talaromyces stipitatus ATCC 10500]|uniref:Uncharacterized protein n=1 Tax=Talaromyces stipitatus (strain ATCC 10500 / CBS 375.48 / QM 6759 / NRRL 1006) TaxID=441959 RepID=B8MK45_TALSN|nr:uncharacterized protein TSTA_043360 [Talaromyces stipitatus ATCC 10500]EED14862.1 hypothetical protein TSTA_043360 [Talaromyces stipitatus ATCC 10500]